MNFAESPMAFRWMADKTWAFVPMQALVGYFLQSFREFPQRQKSASFNIDQVMQSCSKVSPQVSEVVSRRRGHGLRDRAVPPAKWSG